MASDADKVFASRPISCGDMDGGGAEVRFHRRRFPSARFEGIEPPSTLHVRAVVVVDRTRGEAATSGAEVGTEGGARSVGGDSTCPRDDDLLSMRNDQPDRVATSRVPPASVCTPARVVGAIDCGIGGSKLCSGLRSHAHRCRQHEHLEADSHTSSNQQNVLLA